MKLDCSAGGGQVLRTALTLSALTRTPLDLVNIRSTRPNPGLQAQHLTGVKAFEKLGAKTKNASIGSTSMQFIPPEEIGLEKIELDVGTAGSVTLVMQSLFLPLVFSGKKAEVKIKGGTHVKWSPPTDYFEKVFIPAAEKFGVKASIETIRYGFYPQGGGIAVLKTEPVESLKPVKLLEKGRLEKIEGVSAVANLPLKIAERQKASVLKNLVSLSASTKIKVETAKAISPGTFVFLKADYENSVAGFSSLGERGKTAEKVGEEAAKAFSEFDSSQACIDEHLGDQLIPLMSLAEGKSTIKAKITEHLLSNVWVCEQFLPAKFSVEGKTGEGGIVSVE